MSYPQKFLHDLTPSGMPPYVLLLKKGVVIMLLRNLNPLKGLYNVSRMVVEIASRSTITAHIVSDFIRGDIVIIPRIVLAPSDSNMPFILTRRQFPVFGHRKLYVAVSESKDSKRIEIKIADSDEQGQFIKNERRTKFYKKSCF